MVCISIFYIKLHFFVLLCWTSIEATRSRLSVQWTAWSGCSVTCGDGVNKRSRSYQSGLLRRSTNSTRHGLFVYTDTRPCRSTVPCPGAESMIGQWSDWSSCTCSCGGGLRKRRKICTEASTCSGSRLEVVRCNTPTCPSRPTFTVQPESHTGLLGQSLVFCCEATAHRIPSYQWFKNRQPIAKATSNSLPFVNLNLSDSGTYQCRTTSEGMVRMSHPAVLTIQDGTDTCCSDAFLSQLIRLPAGCSVKQNGFNSTWIDAGQCSMDRCIKKTGKLTDAHNTCSRTPTCCEPAPIRYKTVRCRGGHRFRFPTVTRCKCVACSHKNDTVTVRVVGADDCRPIPFATVVLNRRNVVISDRDGKASFKLERRVSTDWIVAEIRDTHNSVYSDLITTIPLIPGKDKTHTVYLQTLAKPIELNLTQKVEILLTNSDSPQPPTMTLTIQQKSLFKAQAPANISTAHIRIQYVDPRSRTNRNVAWGKPVTVNSTGDEIALDIYGIVKVGVRNSDGKILELVESAELLVDLNALAIPVTGKDGKPLIKLFTLNSLGVWEEAGQTELITRRCLHSVAYCVYAIGRLTTFSKVWSAGVPRERSCYVKVRSYDSGGLEIGGMIVTVAPLDSAGESYGVRRDVTRSNKGACVSVKCDGIRTIYAQLSDGTAAILNVSHRCSGKIPEDDPDSIRFLVNSEKQPSVCCYNEQEQCASAPTSDPHFSFTSPRGDAADYTVNFAPFQSDSWYFLPRQSRKYCYARVRIYSNDDVLVRVWSFANKGTRTLYGWREVIARQQNSRLVDVCVEYRCCRSLSFIPNEHLRTTVLISPSHPNGTLCKRRNIATLLRPFYITSAPHELAFLSPRNSWGSVFGIYTDSNKDRALSQCYKGNVRDGRTCGHGPDKIRTTRNTYSQGYAAAFDCSNAGTDGNDTGRAKG